MYVCNTMYVIPLILGRWDILTILSFNGCSDECATSIHHLSAGEVSFFHRNFSLRSVQGQNQWLLEYFNANCSRHHSEATYTFVVCGKQVCKKLWLTILNVSQARYYRVRSAYLKGKVSLEDSHMHQQIKKQSHKSYEAVAWMGNYFDRYYNRFIITVNLYLVSLVMFCRIGDHMPDKTAVHLPSSLTVKNVYERMKEECSQRIVSQPQFYNLWKQHYSNVTIPSVSPYDSNYCKVML